MKLESGGGIAGAGKFGIELFGCFLNFVAQNSRESDDNSAAWGLSITGIKNGTIIDPKNNVPTFINMSESLSSWESESNGAEPEPEPELAPCCLSCAVVR